MSIRKRRLANRIAEDFHEYWSDFHVHDQPYDDEMDADIHERYARVLREQAGKDHFNFKENPQGDARPHFSPSSAGYSDRELYEKARKAKKDKTVPNENQRDWTGLGTLIGDYVQREILLADNHYERLVGKPPKFRMARKENGDPCYEHFVRKMHEIEHDGEHFAYYGLPDGILEYIDEDTGEIIRVGLEVKSVQQNWSQFKALTEPKPKHEAQTVAYSDMYDLDYVIIVYMLTYGRKWSEDFSRIKVFGKHVSDSDKKELRDRCATAVKQAKSGEAPPLNLRDWKFNDYKTAIATNLTEKEVEELKKQAERTQSSKLPDWIKRSQLEAINEIQEIRGES